MTYPIKKLGEIAKVYAGSSAPQEDKYFLNGHYPFVRTGDLGKYGKTKNLIKVSDFLNDQCINEKRLTFAKKGTILFPKSGASILSNHRGILGMDAYFVSHLAGVDSGNNITNKYLYNYLLQVDLVNYCENPSYPSLKLSVIKNISIPLPPLPTQKLIVQKLDSAFKNIDESIKITKKNIENIDELNKSVLEEVFGDGKYNLYKLSEICTIERGGSPRPIKDFITNDENGVNWIKIGDTKNITKYIEKTNQKIKPEGVKRSRIVYPGDFILSNSMSFGRPYIMKTTGCIHDGWLVLRTDKKIINDDFLYHLIGSPYIYEKFVHTSSGTTVKNLNISKVKEIVIDIPPLPKQKEIVEYLDEVFEKNKVIKEGYEKKLKELEEMKQSILKEAFENEGFVN